MCGDHFGFLNHKFAHVKLKRAFDQNAKLVQRNSINRLSKGLSIPHPTTGQGELPFEWLVGPFAQKNVILMINEEVNAESRGDRKHFLIFFWG
jgi:hypothetical protein